MKITAIFFSVTLMKNILKKLFKVLLFCAQSAPNRFTFLPWQTMSLSGLLAIFLFSAMPLAAWSEHALGVYPALEASQRIASLKEASVEELSVFLIRNEKQLEKLLAEEEDWARNHLEHYPPLPESLRFTATGEKATIVARFARAVRIHPGLMLSLYVQADPRTGCKNRPVLPVKQTVFQDNSSFKNIEFCRLTPGEKIHPIVITATAADEPDHGLDIGLFEDNNTPHGSQYAFGPQPFGDPRLEYSSQAPFHMGFYHESPIVYAAAPFLKQTYPEYRIRLYRQLGIFALKNGHPYWGYRFLGWGLHYLTDLTQPYHATVLPGVSTLKMLWINFLAILGFPAAKDNAVNLVSNRHTAIEELQGRLLRAELKTNQADSPLVRAFADLAADTVYPAYSDSYPRETIAREANERAKQADRLLVKALPEKYTSDPAFDYTPEAKEQILPDTRLFNPAGFTELNQYFVILFQSFGAHTRKYMESALQQAQIPVS